MINNYHINCLHCVSQKPRGFFCAKHKKSVKGNQATKCQDFMQLHKIIPEKNQKRTRKEPETALDASFENKGDIIKAIKETNHFLLWRIVETPAGRAFQADISDKIIQESIGFNVQISTKLLIDFDGNVFYQMERYNPPQDPQKSIWFIYKDKDLLQELCSANWLGSNAQLQFERFYKRLKEIKENG